MGKRMLWSFLMIPLIFTLLRVNTIGVTATPATHDIAVISVTPDPTIVKSGNLANITVIVENQGTEPETFNVTIYYDTTAIKRQNVSSLAAGANTSLTFAWNTTGVWPLHTPFKINATASTLPGETDTADNTLVSFSRVRIFESPYIAVFPHCTVNPNLTIGMNYTVSIKTDYNGSDITGWEFTLRYDPDILHCVKVTNGDLITTAKHPNATFIAGTIDNTAGKVTPTAFFFSVGEPFPVTSGPGTLVNITFTVVDIGESLITLGMKIGENTILKGYDEGGYGVYDIINALLAGPEYGQIGHGYFRNTVEELTHDIAVVSVTPYPTSVDEGELVNITVVVENQGNATEHVTVEVKRRPEAGGSPWTVGTKAASNLEASENTSLTITWNTTDARPGKHIIIAEAKPVSGETDTDDNTRESEEMVTVRAKKEQPISIWLIIGIGVAVVAVIVIIVFALRRGRKPIPE